MCPCSQVVQDVPLSRLGCVLGPVDWLRVAGAVYGLVGATGACRLVKNTRRCCGKIADRGRGVRRRAGGRDGGGGGGGGREVFVIFHACVSRRTAVPLVLVLVLLYESHSGGGEHALSFARCAARPESSFRLRLSLASLRGRDRAPFRLTPTSE